MNREQALAAYPNLSGADLSHADLRGADLRGAILSYADLSHAILSYADLSYTDLSHADLSDTGLSGADLRGADLSGADPTDAILPAGETWEVYCSEVVPQLLAAGGHPVPPEAWTCHTWDNCLVACAFGVHSLDDVPALYRPRCAQLIQFFDAGLLKAPVPDGPQR